MKNNKVFNETTDLNPYLACAITEGFCEGEDANSDDQLKAWAYLIKTGQCWQLQGRFGRAAKDLIDSGIISMQGEIDWDEYWDAIEICQN